MTDGVPLTDKKDGKILSEVDQPKTDMNGRIHVPMMGKVHTS